jgi:NitT/TauT family transport system substrate-binding protein
MALLPLYVADEQGFFSQESITPRWLDVRDPGQAAKVFFTDGADIVVTTFPGLLPAEVRQGGSLRLFCPFNEPSNRPGSYLLVSADSTASTPSDLLDKTIGTYSGQSQRSYAMMVLGRMGLGDADKIRLIQVAPPAQVQALLAGSFDALFTVEPYATTAILQGARIIEAGVRPRYIQDPFWVGAIGVSPGLLRRDASIGGRLLRALNRAVDFIAQNEASARRTLQTRAALDPAVAQRCALYTWVPTPNQAQLLQVQQGVDKLVSAGVLDKPISVSSLFVGVTP